MNNIFVMAPEFKRDIKPLAKKYHLLKQSTENFQQELIQNPYLGISHIII